MLENEKLKNLCDSFVSSAYVAQGAQELRAHSNRAVDLLSRRKLPEEGWPEALIERFLWVR